MKPFLVAACAVALGSLPACSNSEQAGKDAAVATATAANSPGASAVAVSPSFDCAKAGSEAEKLVCSDPALARFDNEVARLFALAGKDPNLTPQAASELTTVQRGWVKGRDDCWKASDKRQCVLASYGSRIQELRQGCANARKADAASVSVGPVVFKCEGIDAPLGVTFFTVEPGYAYLQNGASSVMFTAEPKAPDARYSGKGADGGDYVLVVDGRNAVFTRPGAAAAKCVMDEIG